MVQFTKIANLFKGQRGIVNKPDGGCLWHQQLCHRFSLSKMTAEKQRPENKTVARAAAF